jgi:hypothetical protein
MILLIYDMFGIFQSPADSGSGGRGRRGSRGSYEDRKKVRGVYGASMLAPGGRYFKKGDPAT